MRTEAWYICPEKHKSKLNYCIHAHTRTLVRCQWSLFILVHETMHKAIPLRLQKTIQVECIFLEGQCLITEWLYRFPLPWPCCVRQGNVLVPSRTLRNTIAWGMVLLAKKTDVQFRVWWRDDPVRILRDFPMTYHNTPISITLISCLLVVAANKTFQRVFWLPIPQADKCMADLWNPHAGQ